MAALTQPADIAVTAAEFLSKLDASTKGGRTGHAPVAPGFNLLLTTGHIDADYQHAVDAGCTPTMPPQDMFWGDRYGQLKDPFGVTWAMTQSKPA